MSGHPYSFGDILNAKSQLSECPNTPRSTLACLRCGILPEELLYKPKEEFLKKAPNELIGQGRYEAYEQDRQQSLSQAITEYNRICRCNEPGGGCTLAEVKLDPKLEPYLNADIRQRQEKVRAELEEAGANTVTKEMEERERSRTERMVRKEKEIAAAAIKKQLEIEEKIRKTEEAAALLAMKMEREKKEHAEMEARKRKEIEELNAQKALKEEQERKALLARLEEERKALVEKARLEEEANRKDMMERAKDMERRRKQREFEIQQEEKRRFEIAQRKQKEMEEREARVAEILREQTEAKRRELDEQQRELKQRLEIAMAKATEEEKRKIEAIERKEREVEEKQKQMQREAAILREMKRRESQKRQLEKKKEVENVLESEQKRKEEMVQYNELCAEERVSKIIRARDEKIKQLRAMQQAELEIKETKRQRQERKEEFRRRILLEEIMAKQAIADEKKNVEREAWLKRRQESERIKKELEQQKEFSLKAMRSSSLNKSVGLMVSGGPTGRSGSFSGGNNSAAGVGQWIRNDEDERYTEMIRKRGTAVSMVDSSSFMKNRSTVPGRKSVGSSSSNSLKFQKFRGMSNGNEGSDNSAVIQQSGPKISLNYSSIYGAGSASEEKMVESGNGSNKPKLQSHQPPSILGNLGKPINVFLTNNNYGNTEKDGLNDLTTFKQSKQQLQSEFDALNGDDEQYVTSDIKNAQMELSKTRQQCNKEALLLSRAKNPRERALLQKRMDIMQQCAKRNLDSATLPKNTGSNNMAVVSDNKSADINNNDNSSNATMYTNPNYSQQAPLPPSQQGNRGSRGSFRKANYKESTTSVQFLEDDNTAEPLNMLSQPNF